MAALLIGGGLALGSHGGKAVTRVAVNTTAPGAGAVVSVVEDVFAVGFSALMTFFPLVFLALLVLALIGTAWLIPKIVRAVRRMLAVIGLSSSRRSCAPETHRGAREHQNPP